MRHANDEPSCSAESPVDLILAVKELHKHSSQELQKLLKETENSVIHCLTEKEPSPAFDLEKLSGLLPIHFIAVLMSSDRDEALFQYLLSGIRLLHSLCDLAHRHTKLEQILLDDVKVSEQMLDMVFYLLTALDGFRQENDISNALPHMHSALVACSLYLLSGCISSQWQDLVQVLLAHPKVDIFMDVAIGAVHTVIRYLQIELSAQTDFFPDSLSTAEQKLNYLCQQGEASLQFLLSLCQQKLFRDRLVKNKELCGKGGILFLAHSILKLKISPPLIESSTVAASISRLKAKVLSILLQIFEAENISYLDEVASLGTLDLAKSVAAEVLGLLKAAIVKKPNHHSSHDKIYPMGLLQLNAMRLADIFSDDSNFRSYVTMHFTEVLSAIFSLSHEEFLSMWCSSDHPVMEEDATLEYDAYVAAGWILDLYSSKEGAHATKLEFNLNSINISQASYVHQRTSLFVKLIANLHCFVPDICEEREKDLFILKFKDCLRMDLSEALPGFSFASSAQRVNSVCSNIRSLLSHAESFIPIFLNEDDLQLLRVFFDQFQKLISSVDVNENRLQEAQSTGRCSSPFYRKELPNQTNSNGHLKEGMSENSAFKEEGQNGVRSILIDENHDVRADNDRSGASGIRREPEREVQNVESSGSDTSSTRGKNFVDRIDNGEFPTSNERLKQALFGDEKIETVKDEEKPRRKRKRTIMNDKQIMLIERALVDEPDMQRNMTSIQSWADKLSHHGSEVTSSQLRNWINNRKARLARAGKDNIRALSAADNGFSGTRSRPGREDVCESPDSPREDNGLSNPPNTKGSRSSLRSGPTENHPDTLTESMDLDGAESKRGKPGDFVMVLSKNGQHVCKAKIHQVQGDWYGMNLEQSETCVIDVFELRTHRGGKLPYPSEATGTCWGEAEKKLGVMRVLWDINAVCRLYYD